MPINSHRRNQADVLEHEHGEMPRRNIHESHRFDQSRCYRCGMKDSWPGASESCQSDVLSSGQREAEAESMWRCGESKDAIQDETRITDSTFAKMVPVWQERLDRDRVLWDMLEAHGPGTLSELKEYGELPKNVRGCAKRLLTEGHINACKVFRKSVFVNAYEVDRRMGRP